MMEVKINYLAVFVSGVVMFVLGGLWYSPVLFGKRWPQLVGVAVQRLQKGGGVLMYLRAFVAGLISCYVLAYVVQFAGASTALFGGIVGLMCWLGFTAPTSYNNQVNFAGQPALLWLIDSGYTLVSFVIAGAILALWR